MPLMQISRSDSLSPSLSPSLPSSLPLSLAPPHPHPRGLQEDISRYLDSTDPVAGAAASEAAAAAIKVKRSGLCPLGASWNRSDQIPLSC